RVHLAVPRRRASRPPGRAGSDPPCCARSRGDDQLPDARLPSARHSRLLRCVEEAHRLVPADLRRQGRRKSHRSLRRAEGESPVPARRADASCPDRADREAAGEAGHGEGGGEEEQEITDFGRAEGIEMNIEIVETPVRFRLHGIGGVVENERYGEVGLRLMNEMWQVAKGAGVPTTGINHWVYLPDGRMFVGVELRDPQSLPVPDPLE